MKIFNTFFRYILFFILFTTLLFAIEDNTSTSSKTKKNVINEANYKENKLPLPTSMPIAEYEKQLYKFILKRVYADSLNWIKDKSVRDTGPYVQGKYYGTHPAVRIFYSPKVMYWLTGKSQYWPEGNVKDKNPRTGSVPDGAMIIKEMFEAPAARHINSNEKELVKSLYSKSSPGWTVMVKDSAGSNDGWFWSSVFVNESIDTGGYPFSYPNSGFGQGCLRCHAVAEKEFTFSATRNIEGFDGDPITFFVDDSWRNISPSEKPYVNEHSTAMMDENKKSQPVSKINNEFISVFNSIKPVDYDSVLKFPSENFDRIVARAGGAEQFISSDQCMMCHSGGNAGYGYGPVMFLQTSPSGGKNVSPYGEWRWSPMGLAGRDPIFHAQLESELSILKEDLSPADAKFYGDQTVNTCLLCHGAMGKRQYDIDQGVGRKYWEKEANFNLDWYYLTGENDPMDTSLAKYGALGRDGISCEVCHHIEQEYTDFKSFIENNITGQFKMSPAHEIYGPFPDSTISTYPMDNLLKVKPKFNPYIKSSRMCGSCHTINLPVVDYPLDNPPVLPVKVKPSLELNKPDKNPNFAGFMHKIEQATYLEWLNSKFQNEFTPFNKDWKSCQDCHMPISYTNADSTINIDTLKTKIAFTEDQDYPDVDNRKSLEEIKVTFREKGFARHKLQGLNIFLAEIFKQFNDILGVRLTDYETGTEGLDFAIDNFVLQAKRNTAELSITRVYKSDGFIDADVSVFNKTGHRYPSGVSFRRAFVEFLVIQNSSGREKVIWASGKTNGVGVILDSAGNILPTEFLTEYVSGKDTLQHFQQHWDTITSQSQVQIYEELSKNAKNKFTTSFTHRDYEVKDNRLLPMGWSKKGPSSQIPQAFLEATYPGHNAMKDPDFTNGDGKDVIHYRIKIPKNVNPNDVYVKATLYTQEWAPYYLNQRFTNVPKGKDGDARRRLYYLTSNLNTDSTAIKDWKLAIATEVAGK